MPKSKRSKLVSLTKVEKKTKEQKESLITQIHENAEKWRYCWVLEVDSMRSTHMNKIRELWKGTARLFFGRCAVMAKALGTSPEEEHKEGLHKIAKQMQGQVGLFFTDWEPSEVIEWFEDFKVPDFGRNGNIASRDVILPEGPVLQHHTDPPEPMAHSEEPQLRRLGLHTKMVRGVPTLEAPHRVCTKGKPLTSEQAQLLKLVGEKMVVFRVHLKARWDSVSGEVVEIESKEPRAGKGDPGEDDEAMSD